MSTAIERAVALIGNARLIFVGANLFLYLLNHEEHYQMLRTDLFPVPDNSARFGRHDGTMYEVQNYGPLVDQLRSNAQFNIEYVGLLLQTIFMNIGDELSRNEYFDRTPELEFFRHIRNALGHGNVFNFVGNEPVRPAVFRDRSLSPVLNGQRVFFEFMGPGDALDLLDHTEAHLRTIP